MSEARYFEDLTVGEETDFGRYEVSAEEVVDYARQFDPQPFHLDEAAARQSMFGGLIASGWHTGAMMMRMVCDSRPAGAGAMGAMGFDDLRWLQPVRPGDVLHCRSKVLEKIPSRSKPDRGLVKLQTTVFNQHEEPVMQLTSLVLFKRRVAG